MRCLSQEAPFPAEAGKSALEDGGGGTSNKTGTVERLCYPCPRGTILFAFDGETPLPRLFQTRSYHPTQVQGRAVGGRGMNRERSDHTLIWPKQDERVRPGGGGILWDHYDVLRC
jgi:hypothetical protein